MLEVRRSDVEYPDVEIVMKINGELKKVKVKPYERLIDVLRNKLGLTSVKEGCGRGECGACVVIMDNRPVPSCLVLAVRANGTSILTLEGLAPEGKIHAIQKALIDVHALQCGFCFPGVIMMSKHLLDNNPDPSEEEIREALDGNLCRCGSYLRFVKAVKLASKYLREGRTYFDESEVLR